MGVYNFPIKVGDSVEDEALQKLSHFEDDLKVIDLLQQAYASEIVAFYQYFVGMYGVPDEHGLQALLDKLYRDELCDHADKLARRIFELGGNLVGVDTFEGVLRKTPCPYDRPVPPYDVAFVLRQNIHAEECAIKFYTDALSVLAGKDDVTFGLITDILADEQTHLSELNEMLSVVVHNK